LRKDGDRLKEAEPKVVEKVVEKIVEVIKEPEPVPQEEANT